MHFEFTSRSLRAMRRGFLTEDNENEEYIIDEAEEEGEENEDEEAGYSSGEAVKVTRKKRHKRFALNKFYLFTHLFSHYYNFLDI